MAGTDDMVRMIQLAKKVQSYGEFEVFGPSVKRPITVSMANTRDTFAINNDEFLGSVTMVDNAVIRRAAYDGRIRSIVAFGRHAELVDEPFHTFRGEAGVPRVLQLGDTDADDESEADEIAAE